MKGFGVGVVRAEHPRHRMRWAVGQLGAWLTGRTGENRICIRLETQADASCGRETRDLLGCLFFRWGVQPRNTVTGKGNQERRVTQKTRVGVGFGDGGGGGEEGVRGGV